MLLLCIETATTVCSVALFENERLLSFRRVNEGFSHAENLHVFISEVLTESNVIAASLSAIAVSMGPGSYTGLRIGISSAKGLAYALNIPVIGIDTLQLMAAGAKEKNSSTAFFVPMIDARRMEVYTAVYDENLKEQNAVQALVLDEESIKYLSAYSTCAFFGDGMPKAKTLLSNLPQAYFLDDILPNACYMGKLAHQKYLAKQFEDLAYFEPKYLKEFQAGKKKAVD